MVQPTSDQDVVLCFHSFQVELALDFLSALAANAPAAKDGSNAAKMYSDGTSIQHVRAFPAADYI